MHYQEKEKEVLPMWNIKNKKKPLRLSHNFKKLQEEVCSVTRTRIADMCKLYTCIHVNCIAKNYVDDKTCSCTPALIPLCSSCDSYVNWNDFSMLGKQ